VALYNIKIQVETIIVSEQIVGFKAMVLYKDGATAYLVLKSIFMQQPVLVRREDGQLANLAWRGPIGDGVQLYEEV
jgi:hypothetical protein